MEATPRMLLRTFLSFVGGNGSVACPFVVGGLTVWSGTVSLPLASLGLRFVLASLGLALVLAEPNFENERTPVDPYLLSPGAGLTRTRQVASRAVLVSFGEVRAFFAGGDPDPWLVFPASSGSAMASIRLFLFHIVKKETSNIEGSLPLLTSLPYRVLLVLRFVAS